MKMRQLLSQLNDKGFFHDFYRIEAANGLPVEFESILLERLAGEKNTLAAANMVFLLAYRSIKTGITGSLDDARYRCACDTIAQTLTDTLQHQEMAASDTNGEGERKTGRTAELALMFAALRYANLFLKQDHFSRLTAQVKNWVFAHNIREGMLMSSPSKNELSFDQLLAVVPLGLFEPEDLVLVESVKALSESEKIRHAEPIERHLLAWYFAEQGSFERSRQLVTADSEPTIVQRIVLHRLEELGQLNSRFINHRPTGNGNRYEPLAEERFPKLITRETEVLVVAHAVPLSENDPVELVWDKGVISGEIINGCWHFRIPPQSEQSHIQYFLRFANTPDQRTERFSYEVLSERSVSVCCGTEALSNRLNIHTDQALLSLTFESVRGLSLSITPIAHDRRMENTESLSKEPHQTMELGNCTVEVNLEPFWFRVSRQGNRLFECQGEAIRYLATGNDRVCEISLGLNADARAMYGLGERYNALNQAGNRLDQFVYNQYKDQGVRTYIPMPVFYTDGSFGLHIDTESYSWIDLTKASDGVLQLGAEAPTLDIQVMTGCIEDQVKAFISNTGAAENVPAWALGPWMSSNNWDSQAEVERQVELTKFHRIPSTVLVIEAWSDESTFYIFNDARYQESDGLTALRYQDFQFPDWGRWPDPKAMVDYLHDNDLKCLLWQIPVIKHVETLVHLQKLNDEKVFIQNGYAVRHADGAAYRIPEGWFKDSLVIDFTNPQARQWWFDKRQYLIDDLGVDGFKTDGGECIFGDDLVFDDGRSGLQMRNAYPKEYISAYYRFARRNDGITFSRSGYTGAHSFPAHWAGDERSTWDAFKRSMLAGLSAGMSGVIFWGWDLAGFSGPIPSAELYIRSAQMACFCPIMQYHAESKAEFSQDRTPWNIAERTGDDRALTIYRYFANTRMSLLPYLTKEAAYCTAAGTPLMRALVLDHEQDKHVRDLWDEYLLGRDLLIAPVIEQGRIHRSVYLPAGEWWHLFHNRWYCAGTHTMDAALDEIPVLVRHNALLPLALGANQPLGSAMSSNIANNRDRVLLCTLTPDSSIEFSEPELNIAVAIEMKGGVVHVHCKQAVDSRVTIAFATPPDSVILNGQEEPMTTVDVSGQALPGIML